MPGSAGRAPEAYLSRAESYQPLHLRLAKSRRIGYVVRQAVFNPHKGGAAGCKRPIAIFSLHEPGSSVPVKPYGVRVVGIQWVFRCTSPNRPDDQGETVGLVIFGYNRDRRSGCRPDWSGSELHMSRCTRITRRSYLCEIALMIDAEPGTTVRRRSEVRDGTLHRRRACHWASPPG